MKKLSNIPGIEAPYSKKIFNLLRSTPGLESVLLFGSRAKGNYREGSDIDLAVLGPLFTHQNRDDLLQKYDNLNLPWKLDIVIYSLIEEPALKEHIDRVGQELML